MSAPIARVRSNAEAMLELQFAGLAVREPYRAAAFAAFLERGLPTRRVEAWHYTDLRAAMKTAASLTGRPDAARLAQAQAELAARPRLGGARFVLVDGYFCATLSDAAPAGVTVGLLVRMGAPERSDAMLWLNDAFAHSGLALSIQAGAEIPAPLEIVHLASATAPSAVFSQISVLAETGSRFTIVESFVGAGGECQRNAACDFYIGAGVRCDHVGVVEDNPEIHIESQTVSVGEGGQFNGFALATGGALVRRQIFASHDRPGAKFSLAGLTLLDGERRADTTIAARHGAPRGVSREFFRTIVADQAVGTFQGKISVAPHAQKTDGAMKSQAILLSPTATMNNKPELEILADDVACGHGATVGSLDPEQVFYLQARGLPRDEAEAMLLEAFGAEAIGRIADDEIAQAMLVKARAWLAGRGSKR